MNGYFEYDYKVNEENKYILSATNKLLNNYGCSNFNLEIKINESNIYILNQKELNSIITDTIDRMTTIAAIKKWFRDNSNKL